MATVFDVAKYILEKKGGMTAMKLQKLVYYAQAWTLVWDEEPLFQERIEAWANGAVVPALYAIHRRMFKVSAKDFSNGRISSISKRQRSNIDKVLDFYSKYTAQQLSDINHQEDPWIKARNGLPYMASSNNEITKELILEYYSGIWKEPDKDE